MKLTIFDRLQDNEILENLPNVLCELKNVLFNAWFEQDINRRDKMNADFETMDRREFNRKYGNKTYEFRHSTNHKFQKADEKIAEKFVIGIVNRIEELVGKIIDCSKLVIDGLRLSGVVKGERGSVKIETVNFYQCRMHHNVKIDKMVQPQIIKPECRDLNYWFQLLDDGIENCNFDIIKRARDAIKRLMKGGEKKCQNSIMINCANPNGMVKRLA